MPLLSRLVCQSYLTFTRLLSVPLFYSPCGTPNDTMWPGVSSLPDWKPNFPAWPEQPMEKSVPNLEPAGIDLLKVSPIVQIRSLALRLPSHMFALRASHLHPLSFLSVPRSKCSRTSPAAASRPRMH